MDTTIYYVSKLSETSADTVLAVGFASYLADVYRLIHGTDEDIYISDLGTCYAIELPRPLAFQGQIALSGITLVRPLTSERQLERLKKKGDSRTMSDGFDYDAAMEQNRVYRERVKQLPARLKTPDARLKHNAELEELIGPEPGDSTYLGHYQTINMMKIAGSFNDLVQRWADLTEEQMHLHLALLLDLFSDPDNEVDAAIVRWQKLAAEHHIKGNALVSSLQIVNPTTGKGANRARAGELTIGNQESFWLLELLKFRGFVEASAPLVVRESKDRKTYVLQPRKIELKTLQATMRTLRAVLWPTSVIKLDILASLRLAQIFVRQYSVFFERNLPLRRWMRRKVASIASGLEVSFYKDLGSAYATMNVSELHLPLWLPELTESTQTQLAEALLDEHVDLIQHISNAKGEEGAEEYELLRFYRDFLSGDDLTPFWQFTTAYSGYLMSAREKDRFMPQITIRGLESLLMNKQEHGIPLTEITSNAGFRRIASAIRDSTVTPQYHKAQKNGTVYEIRYGLGQELMRKVHHRDGFLCALSTFLIQYNAETTREEEKVARSIANKTGQSSHTLTKEDRAQHKLRWMVSTQDLDEISTLMDRSGSPELIGSLLVAYGYAFDNTRTTPREEGSHETNTPVKEEK